MKGGIIKNAYPLKIDKPRGYQLNSADNKKAIESKVGLYSFRSKKIYMVSRTDAILSIAHDDAPTD